MICRRIYLNPRGIYLSRARIYILRIHQVQRVYEHTYIEHMLSQRLELTRVRSLASSCRLVQAGKSFFLQSQIHKFP